jgi:hypothetical protein
MNIITKWEKKMRKKFLGWFIIGSAFIWGVVIVVASFMMRGVENRIEVISVLSTGATIHLILIWGPLAARLKKELS